MLLIWGREVYLGFYVGECPMFQKKANQHGSFKKKRKENCGCTLLLIN
jgi:hypothetical protein